MLGGARVGSRGVGYGAGPAREGEVRPVQLGEG